MTSSAAKGRHDLLAGLADDVAGIAEGYTFDEPAVELSVLMENNLLLSNLRTDVRQGGSLLLPGVRGGPPAGR